MAHKKYGRYLTAIDIGTTKICVLILAETQEYLDVIGIGHHPSYGLSRGVVIDVQITADSIKKALLEAQKMAGVIVESAVVGISGGHIKSYNSTGVAPVKHREVRQVDIDRAIESARAIPISEDQEILHVIPQYFSIDSQPKVLNAMGMYGVRLESQVHIITGSVASAQNIIHSCELAGIKVIDIVLEQLASADAVLTDSEREMGVGILDIGGGTSDFALYKESKIRHSKVLPFAGNNFTNDLAVSLRIPREAAEQLKLSYGSVFRPKQDFSISVNLGYEGESKGIYAGMVADVLYARANEIFDFLTDEILEYKLAPFLQTGLVLTGGGSLLLGLRELAEKKFALPTRIGRPIYTLNAEHSIPDQLKNPMYSTGYGLAIYETGKRHKGAAQQTPLSTIGAVFHRMKSWICDFL